MSDVAIREVGPRDGLQAEDPIGPESRAQLIEALLDSGVAEIEAVSFVSPKAVPSMANPADVLALVGRDVNARIWALVPNVRGAEMAIDAGVDAITVTLSASPVYNEKNVHMSIEESVDQVSAICALDGVPPVDAVISCAFGSPYEGEIPAEQVHALSRRLLEAGADSLTMADTTGMATPRLVAALVEQVGSYVGLHLHETRGTALVNAHTALKLGVRRFDTSIGGLGGSPFAAGAGGNLATEDFVHLLDDEGISTGIDLDRLLEASALVAELVGHAVPSRVAQAGPRTRRAD